MTNVYLYTKQNQVFVETYNQNCENGLLKIVVDQRGYWKLAGAVTDGGIEQIEDAAGNIWNNKTNHGFFSQIYYDPHGLSIVVFDVSQD